MPIIPYTYVTPTVRPAPARYPVRVRYQAPPIAVGVTSDPQAGPAVILNTPGQSMTHIIQGEKVTTCITVGNNMVVCQ